MSIEAHVFRCDETELHVTTSIGVAAYDGTSEAVVLIEAADTALYAAKGAGRNRVIVKYET